MMKIKEIKANSEDAQPIENEESKKKKKEMVIHQNVPVIENQDSDSVNILLE